MNDGDIDLEALEQEVLRRINDIRDKHKLSYLIDDRRLSIIARNHSNDMALNNYVSHHTPDGLSPTDRARKAGFECKSQAENGFTNIGIAENIQMSAIFTTYRETTINGVTERTYNWKSFDDIAGQIVTEWMNSDGHRANILHKGYKYSGLGIAEDTNYQIFITHNFC